MRREEKRRKFHEGVPNMLYPPPPPPPSPPVLVVPVDILREDLEAGGLGESGSSTSSGDDDGNGETGPRRLTRAQRKRLRKKKVKEDASRRRQIVGPLLPSTVGQVENEPQGVRCNASEVAVIEKQGDQQLHACSNHNKVNQRRKAKKLAREREQD